MLRKELEAISADFEGTLDFEVPLSKYAYYRIGGLAGVIATPRTFQALQMLHSVIQKTSCPFFILGWGSNLLFSDKGFGGIIIRMKHLFVDVQEVETGILKLGASLGASSLLRIASQKGYGGLAKLTGIPGSVGGMVTMNAGTHLGEIGSSLIKTEFVNLNQPGDLLVQTRVHEKGDFSYRHNHFLQAGDLITHSYVRFEREDAALVQSQIEELYQRRKATQPVDYPSCGSVFMNPKASDLHAWQVIDRLGLRGHQIGQAQISVKHPNFIINLGGATAVEVQSLIALVKARARDELQIDLHEEVKIIS